MFTIVETEIFERLWPSYWTDQAYDEFITFITENPEVGDIVKGSGGMRKVRWSRSGSGKSGGVRVIYFNRLVNGQIWLVFIYAKSRLDSISAKTLKEMKYEIEKTFDR
ncbi:MAG: type II toxin-antitoxin system RelE/ParE family toxin [Nitrosomonas sp.]|nr:type II toxin-antitoxin system RelE/ParE family toxin [Nitrosomonas sp.]